MTRPARRARTTSPYRTAPPGWTVDRGADRATIPPPTSPAITWLGSTGVAARTQTQPLAITASNHRYSLRTGARKSVRQQLLCCSFICQQGRPDIPGHADTIREQIDGRGGVNSDHKTPAEWAERVAQIQAAADTYNLSLHLPQDFSRSNQRSPRSSPECRKRIITLGYLRAAVPPIR